MRRGSVELCACIAVRVCVAVYRCTASLISNITGTLSCHCRPPFQLTASFGSPAHSTTHTATYCHVRPHTCRQIRGVGEWQAAQSGHGELQWARKGALQYRLGVLNRPSLLHSATLVGGLLLSESGQCTAGREDTTARQPLIQPIQPSTALHRHYVQTATRLTAIDAEWTNGWMAYSDEHSANKQQQQYQRAAQHMHAHPLGALSGT